MLYIFASDKSLMSSSFAHHCRLRCRSARCALLPTPLRLASKRAPTHPGPGRRTRSACWPACAGFGTLRRPYGASCGENSPTGVGVPVPPSAVSLHRLQAVGRSSSLQQRHWIMFVLLPSVKCNLNSFEKTLLPIIV